MRPTLMALTDVRRVAQRLTAHGRVRRRPLAELRLGFHVVPSLRRFHERYIGRNRALLGLLEDGDVNRAAHELDLYLRDSEQRLLTAHREELDGPSRDSSHADGATR